MRASRMVGVVGGAEMAETACVGLVALQASTRPSRRAAPAVGDHVGHDGRLWAHLFDRVRVCPRRIVRSAIIICLPTATRNTELATLTRSQCCCAK